MACLDGRSRADVAEQPDAFQAQSRFFRGGAVGVEDGHARAGLGQPGGDAFADSLACTGNYRNLSL